MTQIVQDNDNGFLVEGTVYARNRRIAGSPRLEMGNTTSLKLKAKSETKKRISRKKGSAGKALDSVTIADATEIAMTLDTFNKTTLAMILMGETVMLDTAANKVTDEIVRVTEKGIMLDLANKNIDPATVKVKNTGNHAVAATDIEVNANMGWITVKADCANVNKGEDIKVTYSTRAGGGIRIAAETLADFDLELWVDGFNHASQKQFSLHIPSAVLKSGSELDWLADDFNKADFDGTVVLADGNNAPYFYEEFN
ncbi:hypothetical protein LNQ82_02780 [Conchiformibius steedae DSM 2580]|uniref:Uncharacterized protein n=2 Tax=Conchiformibius steedae TaxID=153493 RepID=A0A3P2A5Y0_9NEIS|nr:hypothetical protein [Conchiformibius steedae]QMT33451.1 hypothetical protein H3L98_10305 [Conchiformibius steedae]RRD89053.1 hypothetical protein EII21_10150 [Conchiformibius steedae]URD68105.1 hypothetical protein LNQ82_02780 [Conchiformibius steedae DSM 2580]